MPTIEEQIHLLAEDAHQRSLTGAVQETPIVGRDRRWMARLAAAAAVVAVVGAGLVLLDRPDPEAPATAQQLPAALTAPAPNEPTVEAVPGDMWLAPSRLPDGWEIRSALVFEGLGRQVTVGSIVAGQTIDIWFGADVLRIFGASASSGTTSEFGDGTWVVVSGTIDDLDILATSATADEAAIVELLDSVEQVDATTLPRPPLNSGGLSDTGVVVAEGVQDGVPKQLVADSDGILFALSVGGGSGGPERLGDDAIVVAGASGPNPNLVLNGKTAQSLVWGIVHPEVRTVEVLLTDGSSITVDTQDTNDRFNEDFFLVAVPTTTEGGMEMVQAVIALDAAGTELQRIDGIFG